MAAVKNAEIPEVFNMFGDCFNFLKKYCNTENNDTYWEALKAEREQIYKKYNTRLCYDILTAIVNDIGTREEKNNNGKR